MRIREGSVSDNALQVSLRDVPPHPGGRVETRVQWVVPSGWETEVLALPAGVTIPIDVELTSIDDGVLVRAWAQSESDTKLRGECVRCLDPVSVPWRVDTAEVYLDAPRGGRRRSRTDDDIEFEGDEMDRVLQVENDCVDIEPLLRDAIIASAPLQPVCSKNCLGLCAHCGIRLAEAEPGHHHEFLDPRFAALQGMFDGQDDPAGEADR